MICAKEGCDSPCWGGAPFCPAHLLEHINTVLTPEERERFWHDLSTLLNKLKYREREVVKLRLGFRDGYQFTMEEISRIFRQSKKRTLEIEASAIRHLHDPLLGCTLGELLEVFGFAPALPQLVQAVRTFEERLAEYILCDPKRIFGISPRDFERLMGEVFGRFGFRVELTQQTRDGGCDLIAMGSDSLGIASKYVIECKRYSPDRPVRVGMVRALYGVKQGQLADHALLATTSYFTRDAVGFANQASILNLHLKGFDEIMRWLRAYQQAVQQGGILLGGGSPGTAQ